jgi:hypothetical protein
MTTDKQRKLPSKILLPFRRRNLLWILTFAFFSSYASAATGARGGLFGAGGRFKGGTDPIMEKFNESISVDNRYAIV